jgi:glycosyltransferase involved in cell wall biosynthesis
MTTTCVIASYGYGHLAAHCIETVLEQSKKFDRVIFCDDGAGDCGILPVIYPEIGYILREHNMGTVANFNALLDGVDTDRVMFLGADNWLRQDALKLLSMNDADIITYDIQIEGEHSKRDANSSPRHGGYYWDRSPGHHGSMIYNVSKAKDVGGYGSLGYGKDCEDSVLFDRMMGSGASRVHIPVPLLHYRRHRRNCTELRVRKS